MLAITGMPVADGSLLTAPIVLVANTADAANTLSITLDDTNSLNPGVVVATISDGSVTRNVWNFSGITFTGTFDTPGDILNTVSITSRYGFSLTADPGSSGNFYAWRSVADFTPGTLPDVQIDLENVDVLSLAAPLGPTSIVGTFETPTMIPAAPRGQIAITSNTGIEVGVAGVEVYDLSLDNNHAGTASAISFLGAVTAKNDLTIRDSNTITVSQLLSAGGDLQISTITSPGGSGDIFVNAALKAQAGDVSLIAVNDIEVKAPVESVLGGIKIDADDELLIDAKLKAQDGIALVGDTKITLTAAADLLADTGDVSLASANGSIMTDGVITTLNTGGVTFNASTNLTANTVVTSAAGNIVLDSANGNVVSTKALLAKAGDITLSATLGNVTTTADVEATAGSVAVKAGLAASLTKVTAFKTIEAEAGTDVTLTKAVTVTGASLGTGLVKLTADAGNLLQQVLAPITVVDGKIELMSVAGTVSLNSLVQSNLEIGINAGQGIALDNAVDLTAAVRTTGVDGTITIKSDANAIVINAPVTSQADAIEVLSVNGPVDVRDDMSALLDLSITGKTTVTAHSVPDLVTLSSQTGTLTLESTAANVVIASDVTLVAAPGAQAGISLLAATTVTAPIVLQAEGDITIKSPDGYTVTKSITSNLGTIAITTAAGPLTSVLVPLTAGKNISLEAAGPVTIDNQLKTTTGGINLQSTGGSVSIAPTAAIVAPDAAGGTLTIDAGTFVSVGIPVEVGNDVTVTTGASWVPTTDITTTNGSIAIVSTNGDLDVSGITLSAVGGTPPNYGSAFLSAFAGTLTVDLTTILLNSDFGNLTLIGGSLVGFGGAPYSLGGTLTVQTGSSVVPSLGEDLDSKNGDINIRSTAADVDVSNIFIKATLGSITLESDAGDVIVGTKAFLVSSAIHTLPTPPWPADPGRITLRAGGTAIVNQPLTAANTITIQSTNTFLLEHNLVSDFADVSVTSTAGSILIDDSAGKAKLIEADVTTGTITLSANGAIDNVVPGQAIATKLYGKAMVAKALGPSGFRFTNPDNDLETLELTLPNGTGVQYTDVDSLSLSGGITVTSGDVEIKTLLGPLAISADIDVALGNIDLESVAGSLTMTGEITLATATAAGVTLSAATDLTSGGILVGTGDVFAIAKAGDLTVGGDLVVGVGKIELVAEIGDITVDGKIATSEAIDLTAGAGLLVTGDILAGTKVSLAAGATTRTLTNGIELNGAEILAGTGDINILQVGSAVDDGILIDGDMTASAGSIYVKSVNSSIKFSGGTITAAPVYVAGPPTVGLVRFEAALGIWMPTATPTPPTPPTPGTGFVITLSFDTDVPQAVIDASTTAALRWEQVITGDLPDVTDPRNGNLIDDILIEVQMGLLGGAPNGPGGALANAGPRAWRDGGQGLPYRGEVGVDPFDAGNAGLVDIMIHEFGHVLGFPSSVPFQQFVTGNFFTGPNAVLEYQSIFGGAANPAGVPLETGGGTGTAGGHWAENVFGRELMTGFLDSGFNPLSRVTVAAFDDMGYVVDYSAADAYTPLSSPIEGDQPLMADIVSFPTWSAHGPAHIIAGRLEVLSINGGGTDLLDLTGAVSTLMVIAKDSHLRFVNEIPLTLTDFDNFTPSIQIDALDVSIVSPRGIDVIDGIAYKGDLELAATESAVRFFPVSPGDNFNQPFLGTLRDHLGYVSANTALNQPMAVLASLPSTPLSVSGLVTLDESLPAITNAVLFDGALAPIDPLDPTVSIGGILGIDGSMIAPAVGAHGLTLAAGSSGSHLRNAAIYGFDSGTGIRVESSNNLMEALLIGQSRLGATTNLTANNVGIDLSGAAAARNVIGVQTVGVDAGNVIVNSNEAGILVRRGADFASIFGNFVGTDRTGAALGNRGDGIVIEDTIGTLVGGVDTVLGNAVSNSGRNGILVQDVTASLLPYGARIIGNTIDDNALAGVRVLGGRNNVIGGAQFGAGNRFSGNEDGIVLGSSLTAVTHSNLIEGNFVASSGVDGIRIEYGWNNTVNGNESTGNGAAGIRLFRTVASVGTCVSCGTSGPNRDSNRVTRNVVRNNGATPLTGGIVLEYASGQSIGGDPAIALGNQAYGNVGSGIVVLGGQGADLSRGNRIQGNYLGGNAAGSLLAPNQGDGIRIQGAIVTTISQNTVWASLGRGIAVENSLASNSQQANVVTGNTVTGSQQGIRVSGGSWHQIGSALDGQGNAVFGNRGDGIAVEGSTGMGPAARVFVRGNRVGLDTSNVPSPNGGFGIRITDSNSIVVDSNNVVRHNVNGGVLVEGGTGTTVGSPQASRYENRFYRGLSIVKPFQANVISMNGGPGITIANPANPATPLAVTSKLNVVGNVIELNSGDGVRVEGARVNGVIVGRRPTVGRPDGDGNTIRNNAGGGVAVDASRNVTIIGNQVIGNGPLNTKQIALLNGGNDGVSPPSINSVTPRTTYSATPQYDVVGSVQGMAGQRFFVDFYGNQAATGTQVYLGRVLATIRNGSTMASFRYLATARGVSGGFNSISVTATVAATLVGGTSEFETMDT